MSNIYVEINKSVDFKIQIYTDPISQIFFKRHKLLMENNPNAAIATIKDPNKYSIAYFNNLISTAYSNKILDWRHCQLSADPTEHSKNQIILNMLHKDVEIMQGINKCQGMSHEQQQLLCDMHDCLHGLESIKNISEFYKHKPRPFLPFRYYSDQELPLIPEPVKFKRQFDPGEIKLGFGYVGKEPMDCLLHNDNSMLQQTCKVIDRISLSWFLNVTEYPWYKWSDSPNWPLDVDQALTAWYAENQTDMEALGYSLEKIINHSGFCTVGKITDLQVLPYLRNQQTIEITDYSLED